MPTVKTVRNAFRIIAVLAADGSKGVTELCQVLDLPKSSVHNILETLVKEGVLSKTPEASKYVLGVRLIEFGNRAQANLDLTRLAHPYLVGLNSETGETVHLTVLDNDEVLYVDCVESKMRFRSYSVIGVRAPLHCTAVGKAILAYLPRTRQMDVISDQGLDRFTKNTIIEKEALSEELEKTARRGYAIDNMEHEEFLRCVAAPIFNWKGEVFASISVSGPSQRNPLKRLGQMAGPLVEATSELSRKMGYRAGG